MTNASPAATTLQLLGGAVARRWGWVLLRGILALVAGVLCFAVPMAAIGGLVLVFAVYSAADGIAAIVAAVRAAGGGERWIWFLVEGVINLGAAAVALFLPGIAVLSFVYVIGFWAVLSGAVMLYGAFRLDADHGRWWLGLGGLLSLGWGALLLLQPGIGAVVMVTWFGVYALLFGILLTVLGFRLRSRHLARQARLAGGAG